MVLSTRPLGDTGLNVAPLALGTVKLGRTKALNYRARPRLPSDAQARSLLSTAADLGVNLIDTAPAYGSSDAPP